LLYPAERREEWKKGEERMARLKLRFYRNYWTELWAQIQLYCHKLLVNQYPGRKKYG
jgi:hypothetical protein